MVKRKGLGQANTFRTNNNTSTGYGVAYADEVSGHRTVGSLADLYVLHDWQLSASGENTDNDAIGQLWYVVNADGNGNGCYYQLKDWSKRNEAAGWSIADYTTKAELGSAVENINTELNKKENTTNVDQKLSLKADLDEFNNTVSSINTNIATKANAQDVTNAIGELQDKIGDRVVVSGNVTNNPDEEDITTEGDTPQTQVLKLKDRAYDSLNASGKGYKILRKNWQPINGERKNVLTQAMINEPNTIYEIRYDFDLNGAEIEIKEGCTLKFDGGSLRKGTLKRDVTINNISNKQILYDVNLTISNNTIFAEWFGDMNNDISCDSAIAINKAIQATRHGSTVELPAHNIYISSSVLVDKAIILNGNSKGLWGNAIKVATNNLTAIIVTKKDFNHGGVIKNLLIERANKDIDFIGIDVQAAENYTIDSVKVVSGRIGFYLSGSAGSIYLLNLNEVIAQYCSEYGIYLNKDGAWKNGVHIHPSDVSFNNTNIRVCKGSGNTIQGGATEIGGYLSSADRPSWLTENNGIVIEGGIWTIKDYLWIENCNIGIWVKAGYVNIIDDLYVCNTVFEDDSVVRYENQSLTKKLYKSKINDLVDYAEIIVDGDNTFPSLNNGVIIENFKNYGKATLETTNSGRVKKTGGIDTNYYICTTKGGYISGNFSKGNIRQFTFLVDFKLETEHFDRRNIFEIYLSDDKIITLSSSVVQDNQRPRYLKILSNSFGFLGNIQLGNTEHIDGFVRYIFSIDFDAKTFRQYDESGMLIDSSNFQKDVTIAEVSKKFSFAYNEVAISKLYVFSKLLSQAEINTIIKTKNLLVKNDNYLTEDNTATIGKYYGAQYYDIKTNVLKLKTRTGVKNIQIATKVEKLPLLTNEDSGTMLFYNNEPVWWTGSKWVNSDGIKFDLNTKGNSDNRPVLASNDVGYQYYDTTLKKYIVWNGTEWTNMDGTSLGE